MLGVDGCKVEQMEERMSRDRQVAFRDRHDIDSSVFDLVKKQQDLLYAHCHQTVPLDT